MTAPVIDQRVVRFWTLFGTTLLTIHPGVFWLCINTKEGWAGIKRHMLEQFGVTIPDGTTSAADVKGLSDAMRRILHLGSITLADVMTTGE